MSESVTIYYANVRDERYAQLVSAMASRLPEAVLLKASKFRNDVDSKSYLLGRIMLLQILKDHKVDMSLESLKFGHHGKPYVDRGPKFNISHSNAWVVCAFSSEVELGIDVESIQNVDINEFQSVLSPDEQQDLMKSSSPQEKFYELWTKKEAVSKAIGDGLHLDFKTLYTGTHPADNKWTVSSILIDESVICHLAYDRLRCDINVIQFPKTII